MDPLPLSAARARYANHLRAEVSGDAVLLGIRNGSLDEALRREAADQRARTRRTAGHDLVAFVIPWSSPHVIVGKPPRRRRVR
jgi:hypothetical protein